MNGGIEKIWCAFIFRFFAEKIITYQRRKVILCGYFKIILIKS